MSFESYNPLSSFESYNPLSPNCGKNNPTFEFTLSTGTASTEVTKGPDSHVLQPSFSQSASLGLSLPVTLPSPEPPSRTFSSQTCLNNTRACPKRHFLHTPVPLVFSTTTEVKILCVCQGSPHLPRGFDLTQPALSRHLRLMLIQT